jgi:hypothetical protein
MRFLSMRSSSLPSKKGDPFGDIFAAEFLTKIWRPVEKPKLFDSHRLELQ